ncbi:GNAT family N-acetyltransferase [Sphingomonas sp.]|jgi:predicted GNAT family acetyltransferase|uniref:GNAT family N-acetyltransferase n=1 Tax=Sphingomonas sp. TaxID=28214 RepID=UPI002D7FAB2D|nr:GNAT family N-acetyltransferase [Sphingomonas sp.]HEU0045047.1 GNAT family N-acetyltransferase [Sphingomonas sp.]
MAHPLDRPIWSALTGPQAQLARGDARAWRIEPSVGHFAAAASPSSADLDALHGLVTPGAPLILFEDAAAQPTPGLTVASDTMVQMVAEGLAPPAPGAPMQPLGDDDAAEMLALATLTRPGPFLTNTHSLGGFVGIREGYRLVAMAGTRLRVPNHVEISAVCTHPDHRGRGHAARLMQAVSQVIIAGGDRPFLHSYASNTAAIAMYERLGFRLRRELTVSFLTVEQS